MSILSLLQGAAPMAQNGMSQIQPNNNYMGDYKQAQQYEQLARILTQGQGGASAYDGLNAILSGFGGAYARNKAGDSWEKAYQGEFEQQNIQRMQQQAQEKQQAKAKRQMELGDEQRKRQQGLQDFAAKEAIKNQINPTKGQTINVGGEGNPFMKELDKKDVAAFSDWRNQAMVAGDTLDKVSQLESISQAMQTGKLEQAKATIGQIFGTDAAADLQVFNTLQKDLVLKQAEKLSGAMSDGDIALLESSLPQFGNDPRANQVIFGLLKKYGQSTIDNFNAAQQHIQKNQNLRGFEPLMPRMDANGNGMIDGRDMYNEAMSVGRFKVQVVN